MRKILLFVYAIIFIALLLLLAFFGVRNNVVVPLDLLVIKTEARLSTLMASLLFTGFILGVMGWSYVLGKIKLRRSMAAKKAQRLEKKAAKTQTTTAVSQSTEAG